MFSPFPIGKGSALECFDFFSILKGKESICKIRMNKLRHPTLPRAVLALDDVWNTLLEYSRRILRGTNIQIKFPQIQNGFSISDSGCCDLVTLAWPWISINIFLQGFFSQQDSRRVAEPSLELMGLRCKFESLESGSKSSFCQRRPTSSMCVTLKVTF